MSLVEKLLSNVDILEKDYQTVKKYVRRIPHKEQNPFGKGWGTVILKYGRYSKASQLIPETQGLISDDRIRAAHFIVLYPKSFVPPNTHIKYYEDSIVHHIPLIVPKGETGMVFEDGEVKKWIVGESISYQSQRLYAGYNFTDEERVLLHIVE